MHYLVNLCCSLEYECKAVNTSSCTCYVVVFMYSSYQMRHKYTLHIVHWVYYKLRVKQLGYKL